MRPSPSKFAYFVIEGANSFATAYYFNYLLFLLRDRYQFGNLHNLAVVAGVGLLYIPASWFGGQFGQKHGYFNSLRLGFTGMIFAVCLGWLLPSLSAILLGLALWSASICFTWPILEALVSEHEEPSNLLNRVGLYNVVWAATMGLAQLVGGWLFERLGPNSLFWLPVGVHAVQLLATWPLKARHDAWLADAPPVTGHALPPSATGRPAYFQRLAWIANPLAYMAINTVNAVIPGIAANLGLGIAQAGALMSIWQHVRTLSFVVLWRWPAWHYRFGWFIGSFALLLASFLLLLLTRNHALLITAQIGFGWGTALIYYSSLYYAMDGSDTHGEHGGIHESLIGIGICGGPAISALTLWLSGTPAAPAAAVGTVLLAGGLWCWRVQRREQQPG
jgi:predicted MFS family arabinose efflux permease